MEFLGSVVVGGAAPAPVTSAFRATHQASMAVLAADGSQAGAIERYLSNDVTIGDRPLISLPTDTFGNSSPTTGSAIRATLSIGTGDIANDRASVSFDWNFISGEVAPGLSNLNDYAVFTVTDGVVTRVFKLADARSTNASSDGWRTSVFELGSAFTLPQTGELRLTVGFAVLNDETPANPSHLLIDNLRLNRPIGSEYEMMRTEAGGSFTTFRERPFASDDVFSAVGATPLTEDASATLSPAMLFANDRPSSGADAASLRLAGIDQTGTLGAVTLTPAGSIAWDPRGRFDFLAQGEAATDSFRYMVTDANGGIGAGRTTFTVTGLNDAPIAMLDTSTASENGTSVSISVLANDDDIDSDDDGTTLRVVAASAASGAAVTFAGLAGAGIVYDPRAVAAFEALAEGQVLVDTVSYTVEDRHGAQAVGTVAVSVVGRNDGPTAIADAISATEDFAIVIPVLTNDSDPDLLDRLLVAAINGQTVAPGGQVTLASGAVVTLAGDGTVSWDPRNVFAALARGQTGSDSFSYTASDGHGGSSTALVAVSVAGLNDAPIVSADAFSATAGTRLTIAASTLLSNDSDVDTGDALRLIGVDGGSATGSVSFDGSVVTWDPTDRFRSLGEGETATDSFTYRVSDNDGATTSGTVSLTVHGVNDAPIAVDDTGITDEDTAVTIRVLGNDNDPDAHDQLTVLSLDTTGTRGQVTMNDDGSIFYDPRSHFDSLNAGQVDHDTFRYRVSDGHGGFDDAVVTVTIAGRSDTERLVDSFEVPFSVNNRTGAAVTTVTQHQETDGTRGLYTPTDGGWLARLDAAGSTAAQVQTFLGQPAGSLPKDIDGTFPAYGSAAKLNVTVQAGDQVSFDWMFDARDFVTNPPDGRADNDFAVLSVTGAGAPQLYRLSDVRHTGDQGASGWRSSVFTAPSSGELTIGFACVNDRVLGAPVSENSVLLVDNVRLNRDFGTGYQIVDMQGDGRFETLIHT